MNAQKNVHKEKGENVLTKGHIKTKKLDDDKQNKISKIKGRYLHIAVNYKSSQSIYPKEEEKKTTKR